MVAFVVLAFWLFIQASLNALSPDISRGTLVRALGDVDSDGAGDFVLACFVESKAWVFSGRTGAVLVELRGEDDFGFNLAVVDDADGDGARDVWVVTPTSGRVELFSTKDGRRLAVIECELDAEWPQIGLAAIHTIHNDGRSDLAVSVPRFGPQQAGESNSCPVHSRSGARLGEFTPPDRFRVEGARFGPEIAAIPDLDGDGSDELAVLIHDSPDDELVILASADGRELLTFKDDFGWGNFGEALSVRASWPGTQGPVIALGEGSLPTVWVEVRSLIDGRTLTRIERTKSEGRFANAIEFVGDVDDDGCPDVLVGEPGPLKVLALPGGVLLPSFLAAGNAKDPTNGGRAFLYSGADGRQLWNARGSKTWDWFGISAAALGDLNGDDVADVVVAGEAGFMRWSRQPFARVLSGRDGTLLYEVRP